MKQKILFLAGLIFTTCSAFGQRDKATSDKGFNNKLVCPFENGMGREPKEAFTWDPPDKKVIMISKSDTAIRSCIDAKVFSINPTEDGTYEMVIYNKDYYFWYYGITKALVNVNQTIKAGQVLGAYTKGQEMEFRMFKDEEPVDPRAYLECTVHD
ncbi:MAG TPA: peptidoglycan DD-metalloendopeptidase family protein [Chitinophagaceae bacterium]|nr:peptidoglycan DD-metalloendopeptidase family protein [Chitinophagaceae bacterium]